MAPSALPLPAPAATVAVLLAAALAVGACGGSAPPERGVDRSRACPPHLLFEPGEPRPVRLRVENRTERTLDVFIDGCWRNSWLAEVPPGKYRQPELPRRLIPFPEGLRFQVFDMEEGVRVGIWAVPVEARGILELVLEEASRMDPDSVELYRLEGQALDRRVGAFAVMDDPDRGFAMIQADPGMAMATWSCAADEPTLGIALPARLDAPEVGVTLTRDDRPDTLRATWPVQAGVNDALVPPPSTYDALRGWFGGTGVLELVVDGTGPRRSHRFTLARLEEALSMLGCWGAPPDDSGDAGPPPPDAGSGRPPSD